MPCGPGLECPWVVITGNSNGTIRDMVSGGEDEAMEDTQGLNQHPEQDEEGAQPEDCVSV